MRGANLCGAKLTAADLSEADLGGANLSGARLGREGFRAANLRAANLSKANLFEAYLVEVDLRDADLSGANLRRADLRGALVSGAIFEDTLLEEARLPRTITREQLAEALFIRQRWELNELVGPEKTRRPFLRRMIDHVDSQMIFEGFESFEGAFEMVLDILKSFWIEPRSPEGKKILSAFCQHAEKDMYGDFSRWRTCEGCEKEFRPSLSLAYVNRLVDGEPVLCPPCHSKWKKKKAREHQGEGR